MREPFTPEVEEIMRLLVAGHYDELERRAGGHRLKAKSIAAAVHGYGRRLICPPPEAFDSLDVIPVSDAVPAEWSVRMNLWSAEEGRSDLTLELTVKHGERGYDIEIDDLHVL